MTGIPVVVVDKGGLPVKKVDERAPVMQVAGNGFGIPITYSDLGAPFIVNGGEPPPPVFDPLELFEGGYAGQFWDFRESLMWSDDGATLAGIGQSVHTIENLTGGANLSQTTSSRQGVLRADGLELDGVDDFYPTGWTPSGVYTILACVAVPATLAATGTVWGGSSSTNGQTRNASQRISNSAGTLETIISGSAVWTSEGDLRDTRAVLGFLRSAAGQNAYLNGSLLGQNTGTYSVGDRERYLGAFNNNLTPNSFLKCKLRQFLVINREMTEAELDQCNQAWSA